MRKAGVMGWPVSHSLSPRLHNYWLKELGIEGEYTALPVKPEDLISSLKRLAASGFCGVNLTIPHKEATCELLDKIGKVDELAKAIGAVNTVIIKDGKLTGTNTDAYGFMENIRSSGKLSKKHKAVVLGAGGAARAVVKALVDEGFSQVVIANRTIEKAQSLAMQFGKHIQIASWDECSKTLEHADLLVNTTSLGLLGNSSLEIDLGLLPKDALVNDLVYVPLTTPLLARAMARGNPTVDGLGMLIHQAVPAFEAWFGTRPEVSEALKNYLLSDA